MFVYILKEAAHMFTEGIVKRQHAMLGKPSLLARFFQHVLEAVSVDLRPTPFGFGEEARQVAFVGTVKKTSGNVSHCLIVQDGQAG
jgi:hypothetical protein